MFIKKIFSFHTTSSSQGFSTAKEKPKTKKVEGVANASFKSNVPIFQKIGHFFQKTIVTWIQSLPSKVAGVFKNCVHQKSTSIPQPHTQTHSMDKTQNQETPTTAKTPEVPQALTEVKKNSIEAPKTSAPIEIKALVPPSPVDSPLVDSPLPVEDKNQTQTQMNSPDESIRIQPPPASRRKRRAKRNPGLFSSNPFSFNETKILDVHMPPSLVNSNNNCWFNSSFELLWAWPQFSKLITEKSELSKNLKKEGKKIVHDYPADPDVLTGALLTFNQALESQSNQKFREAAEHIQRATVMLCPELMEQGKQQDAVAFLQFIFKFLSDNPFFKTQTTREGKGDIFSTFKQTYKDDATHILKLSLNGKTSLQEILDAHFTEKTVTPEDKNPVPINDTSVNHYSELARMVGDPPPFIFIHIERYEKPSEKERAIEIAETQKNNNEWIEQKIKKMMAKNKNMDYVKAKKIIEDGYEFPDPEYRLRKNNTPLKLSEKQEISLAHAFGKKENEPGFKYKLKGTIVHEGSSAGYGHYTANVLSNNGWKYCNDIGSTVKPLTLEQARQNNAQAYALYFERVPVETPNTKPSERENITPVLN